MKLRAENRQWQGRIAPMLASNFIELGYGLQVEAMIAEQFFNRSFEPFFRYRGINKAWYDLYVDEAHPELGYETDWSRFDWYHSGYEHNAWYAWPGTGGDLKIADESTFVINKSPEAEVYIELVPYKGHGEYGMKVANRSEAEGGLAQDGKYLRKGIKYRFSGSIMSLGGAPVKVRLAIYPELQHGTEVSEAEVSAGAEMQKVRAEFTVPEDGRYTFALLIGPGEEVLCDDFSMLPEDSVGIWKKSAVEACRYVGPKLIRFPGGCFASFYDWKEAIGPRRVPGYSYFWGGYNYNDVGTDEFGALTEALGAEAMICLNVFHPFKQFYDAVADDSKDMKPGEPGIHAASHGRNLIQFADIEEGAKNAAAWVEYCNGSTDTYWGRKRAENGHPEPYGFKYWEMDNEVHRWFKPEEYARVCSLYSAAMKAVDPTVKLGMVSYSYSLSALPGMLEICGRDIDFLADRCCNEPGLCRILDIMHTYNETHGTQLKYCNTEWLPMNDSDVKNMYAGAERPVKSFMFGKWIYALDAAAMLLMWQRYGEDIGFINFNNLANTHSQSAIETPKEGAFVTAAGMILHQFSCTRAAYPLKCTLVDGEGAGANALPGEVYHPLRNDPLQVQVSLDESGNAVVVNILNRSETPLGLELDLRELLGADGANQYKASGVVLSAPSRFSMNHLGDLQIRREKTAAAAADGVLRYEAAALSYAELVIER